MRVSHCHHGAMVIMEVIHVCHYCDCNQYEWKEREMEVEGVES